MPNASYEKGRNFEQKLVREYRAKGWYAARTAGSHSVIDIIAISPDGFNMELLQCKRFKKPGAEPCFMNLKIQSDIKVRKFWVSKQDYKDLLKVEVD